VKKVLLIAFLFGFLSSTSMAQTNYTTSADGNWSDVGTWDVNGVPLDPLPFGDTIFVNHALNYNFNQRILGVMIVAVNASVIGANDMDVGKGGVDQGELINYGTLQFRDLDVKPDNGCTPTIVLPVIENYGLITTTDDLHVGNNCGAGSFINHVGGKVNVGDDVHADNYICNQDTITIAGEFKIHGATLECCGWYEVSELDIDENGGRPSTIGCAQFCDGGSDPIIDIDNTTYSDLSDAYNNAPASEVVMDNDSTCVCGLNQAGAPCGSIMPLPVQLFTFGANLLTDNEILVSWVTLSEIDNDYFEVERSTYGYNWRLIGTVDGAGSSSQISDYFFIDDQPLIGVNYYRLKQIDLNGGYEYSWVVREDIKASSDLYLYPNPASNQLIVSLKDVQEFDLLFYNASGQSVSHLISSSELLNQTIKIDVSRLAAGVYFVRFGNCTEKFVIQR
jgi:Secretion system C-terminal sorting domain